MAEIGVIASVLQIADTGLRLSIKLYTFGEIVASADKSVLSISKDVSLTSSVLKELGQVLEKDGRNGSKFLTQTAIKTADDVVMECLEVFEEMEAIIVKKMPNLRAPSVEKGSEPVEKVSKATVLLERLKWPYLQPKLQLLQSNLDRLKSTILLMLNVITYAQQVAAKNEPEAAIADQKSLIEDLAQSNQDYIKKFENLKLGIQENSPEPLVGEDSLEKGASPAFRPDLNLLSVSAHQSGNTAASNSLKVILETYAQPVDDPRLINLQHYFDLLVAMLGEVDELRYQIQLPSRSRVRVAIHDTFDQEMYHLAHPFGNDLSKRVRDHFACLIAASRDKWNSYARDSTSVGSDKQNYYYNKKEDKLSMALTNKTSSSLVDTGIHASGDSVAVIEVLRDVNTILMVVTRAGQLELKRIDIEDLDSKEIENSCIRAKQLSNIILSRVIPKLDSIQSNDEKIIAAKKQLTQRAHSYLKFFEQALQRIQSDSPLQPRVDLAPGNPTQQAKVGQQQQPQQQQQYPQLKHQAQTDYEQQLQLLQQQKMREQQMQQSVQRQQQQPQSLDIQKKHKPTRQELGQKDFLDSVYDEEKDHMMNQPLELQLPSSCHPTLGLSWRRSGRGLPSQAQWPGENSDSPPSPHEVSSYSRVPLTQANTTRSPPTKKRCPWPSCGRLFADLPAHLRTHLPDRPEKGEQEPPGSVQSESLSRAAVSDARVLGALRPTVNAGPAMPFLYSPVAQSDSFIIASAPAQNLTDVQASVHGDSATPETTSSQLPTLPAWASSSEYRNAALEDPLRNTGSVTKGPDMTERDLRRLDKAIKMKARQRRSEGKDCRMMVRKKPLAAGGREMKAWRKRRGEGGVEVTEREWETREDEEAEQVKAMFDFKGEEEEKEGDKEMEGGEEAESKPAVKDALETDDKQESQLSGKANEYSGGESVVDKLVALWTLSNL